MDKNKGCAAKRFQYEKIIL